VSFVGEDRLALVERLSSCFDFVVAVVVSMADQYDDEIIARFGGLRAIDRSTGG
jgi:hypothetical protein